MQTGSDVVLRFGGRKRNATFETTFGSSPALRYDNGAYSRLQFLKTISHSLGAHAEAFQVTSEDDSDRDVDASNHEPVVNSTLPVIATSTVIAVAGSNDVRGVPYRTSRQESAGTMWAFSICSNCADAIASIPNGWPIC